MSLFHKGSRCMRKTKGFAILDRTLLPFFAFFTRLFAPRYNARIQFLIAQTRILRSRIDASRIVPTPEEKEELMRWGAMFDHNIDGVIEVVKPATYRKWLRMRNGNAINGPLRQEYPCASARKHRKSPLSERKARLMRGYIGNPEQYMREVIGYENATRFVGGLSVYYRLRGVCGGTFGGTL